MLDLTPAERRGALLVLGLVALGTLWDLLHVDPVPTLPPPEPAAAAAPAPGAPPVDPVAGPGVAGAAPRIDLNAASAAEFDALPGIGPVLAARIVAHRDSNGAFRRIEELMSVRGIGPALYARLRDHVSVAPARVSPRGPLQVATP